MKTLLTLLQVASIQSRRTPHIPHYRAAANPDRSQLMENIMAIIPNHTHRLHSLAAAEELWEKKRQLHSENRARIKAFEGVLKVRKEQLHTAVPSKELDVRREMKLRALYMEDKFKHGSKRSSGEEKKPTGILKWNREHNKTVKEVRGDYTSGGVAGGRVVGGGGVVQVEQFRSGQEHVERRRAGREEEAGRKKGRVAASQEGKSLEVNGNQGRGVNRGLVGERAQERDARGMEVRRRVFVEARSQEALVDDGGGEMRMVWVPGEGDDEGKSQAVVNLEERWAESTNRKPSLAKEDVFRHPWGRGVASQEVDYSQESQHSLPPRLERVRRWGGRGSQDTEVVYSHSQPEYYPETASVYPLTPPTNIRHKRPLPTDFQEDKRKSIGDIGDLIKVEKYYDTLQRKKKNASSSKESSPSIANSRGVAKQKGGEAHEEFNSSYSGSSVFSVSTGSGIARPSCLKSSSLVTTSSNASSGVEPCSSISGAPKISPLQTSHTVMGTSGSAESGRDEKRSSLIPRSQKARSMVNPGSQISPQKIKKPHIDGFPSRYSMVDYRSRKSETPSPPSAVTKSSPGRSKREKRLALTKTSVSSDDAAVSGSQSSREDPKNEDDATKVEPRSKHVVVSSSKAPFHSAMSHSDTRFQNGYPNTVQKELDEIFDGDTLPVRRRERGKSKVRTRGEQERRSGTNQFDVSQSRPHTSQPPQGVMKSPEASSRYQQTVPSNMKKHRPRDPPQDGPPSHAVASSHHQPAKNSKQVQFKPGNRHVDRPHPLVYRSSGIPMRATKSLQMPMAANEGPLTSYPRSHTQAMKQRSASNGRVHQHHPGHTHHAGGRQHGGGIPRRYGDGNVNNEMMIGSLV
jgi:hypothetical protein